VALLCAGAVVGSQTLARVAGFGGHSEHVLELIEAVTRDAGRELAQCDAIAFGAGPGAFTGLRVACAVAQGLAFGLGCPVVPVDCLAAIALESAERSADRTSIVLVAQDARIGELYVGIYRVDRGAIEVLESPFLIGAHDLSSHIGRDDIDVVVGSGAALYPALQESARYAVGYDHPDARYVGQLATHQFLASGGVAPRDVAPIYIRDRVALTISERAAGVRLPA
jgi:tRNA threonylcarbamoyladenosine biosynthesis protein TsaB